MRGENGCRDAGVAVAEQDGCHFMLNGAVLLDYNHKFFLGFRVIDEVMHDCEVEGT